MDNTLEAGQGTVGADQQPFTPQANSLDRADEINSGDELDNILQQVEAEELDELKMQVGEEAFAKIYKSAESGAQKKFIQGVNEETGREYKDIEAIAKTIKEGAKYFQKAKELEARLQGNVIPAQQVQGVTQTVEGVDLNTQQVQPVNPQQPQPQVGQLPQDPAIQQVQPNGQEEVMLQTRADLLEIKDPNFAKVRNEVIRVARQHNVLPDDVYNGEGLFADYDFKNRAKMLSVEDKSNKVMMSTTGDGTVQEGVSKESLIGNVDKLSPKEIKTALRKVR